jgi:hypothetical protein
MWFTPTIARKNIRYITPRYPILNPLLLMPGSTNFTAAMLPPLRAVGVDLINNNLNNYLAYSKIPLDSIHAIPYKPKFKLDYLASSGIGASVGSYGTGLSSGVQGVFSDILAATRSMQA